MDPRLLLNPKALKKDAKKNGSKKNSAASSTTSLPLQTQKIDSEFDSSSTVQSNKTSPRSIRSYDPRALLNPKGARSQPSKPQQSDLLPPKISIMSQDESESPHSGFTSGSDASAKRQHQHDDAGPRHMLEGLYGVEKRVEQPRKKVKVADTDAEDKTGVNRSTYHHKSNGIVGEYLKPKSDDSESTKIAGLVDLTNSDNEDDDIQVIDSRPAAINNEDVCYGHLNATVHASLVPKPKFESAFANENEWPVMKCKLVRVPAKDMVIEVIDPCDKAFGKITREIAGPLSQVMDGLQRLRTQARLVNRKKKAAEWPHQPCSDELRMIINVYGRRGDAEKIGKLFGQCNIWFRPPMAAEPGVPYVNPQPGKTPKLVQNKMTSRGQILHNDRTIEEATEAVSKLFDYFAGESTPLAETEGPELILTPLLPHQKQALTFMRQHEVPRTFGSEESENSSLWRREHKASGKVVYVDVVSGISVAEEPEQVFGGLLADVMGLGKTLEALSLVASTVDEAEAFSKEKLTRQDDESVYRAHSKATLIVCPTSTVKNWEDQIRDHIKPGSLRFYVYHGSGRIRNPYELSKYDIVIATYGVIASDFSGRSAAATESPIRQLKWFRIILDEAHTIRESKAAQTQAIYSLWAQRRWCLTGTPIQNRIDDLGSLTRFLHLFPYDTAVRFNQYIRGPAQAGDPAFLKALRVFVDSFTLRRLRDRIDLPPRKDLIEKLSFSFAEQQMHDFFKEIAHVQIVELTRSKDRKSGVQHHVLRGIMTLRLICAHGRDLLKEKDLARLKGISPTDAIDLEQEQTLPTITPRAAYESLNLMAEADLDLCKNCDKKIGGDTPQADVDDEEVGARCFVLPCFDLLCADCFRDHKATFDDSDDREVVSCPFCQMMICAQYVGIQGSITETLETMPDDGIAQNKMTTESNKYSGPHTKTLALLRDIAEMKEQSKPLVENGEAPIKCVVFSEFTSHLDLIERALTDNNHTFVRIDGSMSLPKRKKVLDDLANDDNVTILLASIKAAGQGLNLTAASRAFIMEPMWNPAAEAQAVDRIYRIGQKREVVVKRYQMADSIELKIVELQKRKQALADVSMNRNHKQLSKKEVREQHMKDILALFK